MKHNNKTFIRYPCILLFFALIIILTTDVPSNAGDTASHNLIVTILPSSEFDISSNPASFDNPFQELESCFSINRHSMMTLSSNSLTNRRITGQYYIDGDDPGVQILLSAFGYDNLTFNELVLESDYSIDLITGLKNCTGTHQQLEYDIQLPDEKLDYNALITIIYTMTDQ